MGLNKEHHVYEDDEEEDQTKAPSTRGADPSPTQRGGAEPMMQTMGAGGGDIRTMAAPGGMGGRVMPWQQGGRPPMQGGMQQGGPGMMGGQRPDWGAIIAQFRQRFMQHNPFMQRFGQAAGAPAGQPAPAAVGGAAPAPASPAAGNRAPWQGQLDQIAQRFGNRQPGGILGPGNNGRY